MQILRELVGWLSIGGFFFVMWIYINRTAIWHVSAFACIMASLLIATGIYIFLSFIVWVIGVVIYLLN